MSHTITKKVAYRMPADDQAALPKSVVRVGGKSLGKGKFKLYSSSAEGYGFQLPGWRYPIVLQEDGKLAFDDYKGAWGNPKDLEHLKDVYSQEAAKVAAESLGWMTQYESNGDLTVFHPSGNLIKVPIGSDAVEAIGFTGGACAEATAPLMAAMGGGGIEVRKPEYEIETASVRQVSGQ